MSYTIAQLQEKVAGKLVGRSVSRLGVSFYEIAQEAANTLLSLTDPKETMETTELSPAVFDDLTSYVSPDDLKALIDIRPVSGREIGSEYKDDYTRTSSRSLDQQRGEEMPLVAEKYHRGKKVLMISQYPRSGVQTTIHNLDSLTENGTWTRTGDITTIEEDNISYVEGAGSFKLTVNESTNAGTIECTDLEALDLTDVVGKHPLFFAVKYSDASNDLLQGLNVSLRIGNDLTTNYYDMSGFLHDDVRTEADRYLVYRFDWGDEAGNVDVTAFDSVRIEFSDISENMTINVDHLVALQPFPVEIDYYSSFLFLDRNTNERKEYPEDPEDLITVSTESFNVLADLCAYLAMDTIDGMEKKQRELGKRLGFPTDPNMEGSIWEYKRKNPSERLVRREKLVNWSI